MKIEEVGVVFLYVSHVCDFDLLVMVSGGMMEFVG
jgi:hypothetical protein